MQGAYILSDSKGTPDVILMGTGSELGLCVEAAQELTGQGIKPRVVSMPCWELFEQQPESYREKVLPASVTARVAVEAGIQQGWEKYLGNIGKFVGMTGFGASAPFEELYEHFGITTQAVVAAAIELVKK
jgi:transketolase